MSIKEMWVIMDDEADKIIGMSEKKEEAEYGLVNMKVKKVLNDLNVKESDFNEKMAKIKVSMKKMYITYTNPNDEQEKKLAKMKAREEEKEKYRKKVEEETRLKKEDLERAF